MSFECGANDHKPYECDELRPLALGTLPSRPRSGQRLPLAHNVGPERRFARSAKPGAALPSPCGLGKGVTRRVAAAFREAPLDHGLQHANAEASACLAVTDEHADLGGLGRERPFAKVEASTAEQPVAVWGEDPEHEIVGE